MTNAVALQCVYFIRGYFRLSRVEPSITVFGVGRNAANNMIPVALRAL
jgi:hypothetical protein